VFAVYNGEFENIQNEGEEQQCFVKKSYIFVSKSKARMIDIFQSMCQELILDENEEVQILKNMQHLEKIKFSEIRDY
jgi:hypothetical protein